MYLTRLDHKEKEYFLELAHYVANVDKDFSQTEQDLIIIYCREMGIKKYEIKSMERDGGLSPSGNTWKGDWPFQVFPEQ